MNEIIQFEDKYYISVNSSYADNRVKVLNHANTFGIFDRRGDVKKIGEEIQGIYHNGTRFISDLELRINNMRPLLLSSSVKEQNEILSIDLTNPAITDNNQSILLKDTLYIGRSNPSRCILIAWDPSFREASLRTQIILQALERMVKFLSLQFLHSMIQKPKKNERLIFKTKVLPTASMTE